MRLRVLLGLTAVLLISSTIATAEEPLPVAMDSPQRVELSQPLGLTFGWSQLYAQGWPSYAYGYPYFGSPYQTPHFPYLYFYEQYSREAEESRRAADEYEASLAREGKLTGPLPVGAFTTDYLPRSPLKLRLMLDGQAVAPSPSGAPLVIESGEHRLNIGVHESTPGN